MSDRTHWDCPSTLTRTYPPPDTGRAAAAWADPRTRVLPVTPAGELAFTNLGPVWCPPDGAWQADTDIWLGMDGDTPLFARIVPDEAAVRAVVAAEEDVSVTGLRAVADALDGGIDLGVVFTALALAQWHADAPFCPRCGAATTMAQAGRTRWCPVCRAELFPRQDPAMIVAVIGPDDRLLLGHHRAWAPRRVSVLAGFVEAGESVEQSVRREVAEEVGLTELTDLRYIGSQPWPFPRSLMLGYMVRSASADVTVDENEIAWARWFSRSEWADALETGEVTGPMTMSMAHRLIETWRDGC